METVVRNFMGAVIGRYITDSNGDIVLYSGKLNRYLGRYCPNNNTTFNAMGNVVGFGNVLATLINEDE